MRKILCIGDVISQIGCDYLKLKLPGYRHENGIDVVMANGENSAVGNGILPVSADFLLTCGVDVITTGNHVFKRREILPYFENSDCVIRPLNYPSSCIGRGSYIYDGGGFSVAFVNLLGTAFMEAMDCPFDVIDAFLEKNETKIVVVDFHAEATGEKKAMAYYLDGRVSLLVGTHTHIQTNDAQILPQKTGYITDLGMTGPIHSVLGVVPENIIARYKTKMPTRFETAEGECRLEGVVAEIDEKTGSCISIEAIRI